jgi:integrase
MLTVYRRHLKTCSHASKGRNWRRCACPVWVAGTIAGQKIKRSLNLTSLEAATEKIHRWESMGRISDDEPPVEGITIADAIARFMADARARNLTEQSLKKYRVLLHGPAGNDPKKGRKRSPSLLEFTAQKGIKGLGDLSTDLLRQFRASWVDGPLSGHKKLERLKAFFRFATESDWLEKNPAAVIKAPTSKAELPTMPFEDWEVEKLHKAIPAFREARKGRGPAAGSDHLDRLPVLLRVMEYSGLRVGDTCKLSTDDLVGNKLVLNTQKSGTRVCVPLPTSVIEEMRKLRPFRGRYFFWTGVGKVETASGNYRRTLRELAAEAGVKDAHPHRFRDTFAVRLLQEGVPMERVSKLLGHQSMAITEAHYAPWVKALQDQLEADVARVWARRESGKLQRTRLRRIK